MENNNKFGMNQEEEFSEHILGVGLITNGMVLMKKVLGKWLVYWLE